MSRNFAPRCLFDKIWFIISETSDGLQENAGILFYFKHQTPYLLSDSEFEPKSWASYPRQQSSCNLIYFLKTWTNIYLPQSLRVLNLISAILRYFWCQWSLKWVNNLQLAYMDALTLSAVQSQNIQVLHWTLRCSSTKLLKCNFLSYTDLLG